ncbi:uncharacterized protein LOC116774961 [Danaus plexippus]|uniref:uncharacterized protein LOC116774961 n=1 Tax=Danaus plexippus TaxID=13037 RepID=UPI002AAF3BA2|nr:uncharacterized protein LOC116774961 [Danaus plexippus]
MDANRLSIFLLVVTIAITQAWQYVDRRPRKDLQRDPHYVAKRHMLPGSDKKRRPSTQIPKEMRKKPSGHLKPLQYDEMENDEVVSVAIGPPAMRPKYDKTRRNMAKAYASPANESTASNLIKDILVELGREFVTHNVNEDFVFGQYVGNVMKNLTSSLKMKMQHEILDLILKYQRICRGDDIKVLNENTKTDDKTVKDIKLDKKPAANETEDGWPDFSNIEKYVG